MPAFGQEVVASVSQGTNMAVALSPDGTTLVIDLMGQLWSLPASGGGAQPLFTAEGPARNPRFSPDGNRLVYQQYSRGQWDLWLLELATGTRRRLTGPQHDEREPDFSADGRAIVYVSDSGGTDALHELDLATDTTSRITFGGEASWPAVSERGEIVFVERRGDEWSLLFRSATGAISTLLTSENPIRAPSWRPGGGVVLFTELRGSRDSDLRMMLLAEEPLVKTLTGGEDVFGFRAAWRSPAEFVYTSDGRIWWRTLANATRYSIPLFAGVAVERAPRPLHTSAAWDSGPYPVTGLRAARRSPSGELAAFTALGDLWLQRRDGDLEQLTDDHYLDIDPTFTPESDRLIFASDRAGGMDLWTIDLETRALERITSGIAKEFAPAVSPDGRGLAYLSTEGFGPWAPAELLLIDLDAPSTPERLAQGLRDATAPSWGADARALSLTARDPRAGQPQQRARLEVDLESRTTRWLDAAETPGEDVVLVAQPELSWSAPEPAEPYVVQVDRLFDGVSTQYRRHMDIHVDGQRISAVAARGLHPLPERIIDARGKTVIPGLIDLHAHQSALAGERLGRIWLAYGVTTVREIGGTPDDGRERRESWASGRRLGPRLLLSAGADEAAGSRRGPEIGPPSYDALEIYRDQPLQVQRGLIQSARMFGVPVFSEELFPGVRLGINGLEHIGRRGAGRYDLERSWTDRSYRDVIDLLAQSEVAVIPALTAFGGFGTLAERRPGWLTERAYRMLYTPAERGLWRDPMPSAAFRGVQDTVVRLIRAGGRIAAGSDAPSVPYGLGLHAELSLLIEAGVPNDQALRLVTAGAALALGLERELGTIEAGKLADFVIVDGNPLTDMADSLEIEAVVVGGRWIGRDELLEQL